MPSTGTATWYDLCDGSNGAGAGYGCPCDDDSIHVAYAPMPQTNCTTSYGYGCNGTWPSKQYCNGLYIEAPCGDWIFPSMRDCPCFNTPSDPTDCQDAYSAYSNDCANTLALTIADLTNYAFASLGFSLSVGRVLVYVNT